MTHKYSQVLVTYSKYRSRNLELSPGSAIQTHPMYLRGILGKLAPLIILAASISVSTSHYLPGPLAGILQAPQKLNKRTNPVTISGMTLRGSRALALILPIQIAASQFESLYAHLYQKAISELYENYLGSSSFTLQYSTFEISFVASSGDNNDESVEQQQAMVIPWEFVRDFATVMGVITQRGYTGCYDQGYWNEMGTFGIYVGLRVRLF